MVCGEEFAALLRWENLSFLLICPDDFTSEETGNTFYADERNFYKVEKWTRDGTKVDSSLYAGNKLGKAQEIFASAIKRRPRIRQRARVLHEWPP